MSTFVELTDFLPKSLENDIYESTMATFMPWYYSDSTIHKGNNTLPSHPDIRDSSQFVHLALWPDQENSWIWNVIKPVLYFFEKETGTKIKDTQRCKINLLQPSKNYQPNTFHPPHNDGEDNQYSLIYYVNDSDGDTYFFNEFFTGVKPELTIYNKVTPKKGKAVFFDSARYHCSSNPVNTERRVAINFVFGVEK